MMEKNKSLIILLILSLSLPIFAMAQGHHDRSSSSDYRNNHGPKHDHGRHYHYRQPNKYLRWSMAWWWAPVAKPCYFWHGHCHHHPRYYW